ncbi:MAG: hypothetical protein PVI56_02710 [Gammaproteobacteria bacterium]|jgi:phosphatidylserine decarboxylase
MAPSGFPLLAREGWLFLIIAGVAAVAGYTWIGTPGAFPGAGLAFLVLLKFRDPERSVPPAPLGVLSPVDGSVLAVEHEAAGCLDRPAVRITLRVALLGAYSIRSPVEGKVLELPGNGNGGRGVWLQTDEKDDVVMVMRGPSIARPRARVRYGERLGQGQRCGYVRLARRVELLVPEQSRINVQVGQRVRAGITVCAEFIHDGVAGRV